MRDTVEEDIVYTVWLCIISFYQGVTKRCRLPWPTNSVLVYEPKCWGGGGKLQGLSCAQEPKKTAKNCENHQRSFKIHLLL